ncbi:MAG: DUF6941 family protein [Verrucomicrobiia bacterium]
MNLQIAVLCDAATDYGGKLNLLGTFDTIIVGGLPAVHPHCAVALRVVFDRGDEGKHMLRLCFVDEDGKPIMMPVEIPFEIVIPPDAFQLSRNFIVNIQHLQFSREGHYAINITLGDQLLAAIPLKVKQARRA